MFLKLFRLFVLPDILGLGPATFAQSQANPFFDDTVAQQINLTVAPGDWATLLANDQSDTYFGASFAWSTSFEEVGIRQHGIGTASTVKPNLDIDFAQYSKKQIFLGLSRILLKANNDDPSNMREWLTMKFFRRMGFPAQLYVNGQLFGYYAIAEKIDDTTFLTRNLGENGGYLYDWVRDYSAIYEFQNLGSDPSLYAPFLKLKSNQAAHDLQTFCNLVQVIRQPSSSTFTDADFITALSQYIDPKSFLTFAATNNVLSQADGIVGGIVGMNNFYLYQFQGTTFYQLIPWDAGSTFSSSTTDVMQGFTLHPNINILAQRLAGMPEYLNFYLGQVSKAANLLGGTGGWADTQVTSENAVINAAASNDPNKQCDADGKLTSCGTVDFQNGAQGLHYFLAGRSAFVLPEVQNYGYQPVTTDAQISMSAIAPPQAVAAPGALVKLTGANLGPAAQAAPPTAGNPLPRALANTYVAVEGVRAPLVTTAEGQIELQMPDDLPAGAANIVVSVAGEMSNTFVATIQASLPQILTIVHQSDASPVTTTDLAIAGEMLVLYTTGLGAATVDQAFGAAAPSEPAAFTAITPQITLGSTPLSVVSSELSPGFVGLYQATVIMPGTLPQGSSANFNVSAGPSASASAPHALAGQ